MKPIVEVVERRPWVGWVLFAATLAAVFLVGLLGASIVERRGESAVSRQVKPLPKWEPRNEVWGENYPREFETYARTAESTTHTKYGGSAVRDLLEENPRLVVLWAGYAFSRDYKQARGHYRAVEDIRATLRTGVAQPATCWSCKSTDVPRVMEQVGVSEFYRKSYTELGPEIVNNIGCQDCHDPESMNLRITRPALAEAWTRQGKDITKATHQEMRSLVCAQCHVEYYFKGKEDKHLTFPWDKGYSAEQMESYYDSVNHVDWVHKLSRAPMLKAQHPDYELYRTGIHAERGVACADCHMPYRSEGGVKFTDHHIRSPLENVAGSCAVCHRESEETLKRNVFDRQDKVRELLARAEDNLAAAHVEAKAAWDAGATEEEMAPALRAIRHAQWRWDWVAAANGVGFHNPLESARVLGSSIELAKDARSAVARVLWERGHTESVSLPDLSTKDKAQAYIGLDRPALEAEKARFLESVAPEWDRKAAEREAGYGRK